MKYSVEFLGGELKGYIIELLKSLEILKDIYALDRKNGMKN